MFDLELGNGDVNADAGLDSSLRDAVAFSHADRDADSHRQPDAIRIDDGVAQFRSDPDSDRIADSSMLTKPVNTYALVRGLATAGKGRYTITYDPVVLCTKAAVSANEAPKQCKPKPAKTAADGSWTVRTTTSSVIATLSSSVSGTVYPAGVPFAVTAKNLAMQKARNGVIFDWSAVTVPALLTVAKNEIETVAGARPSN